MNDVSKQRYQNSNRGKALATSEWMPPDQVRDLFSFNLGNIWLGRDLQQNKPIGFNDDRHVCLVSGSRGGKGTTTLVPNIALWPGSIVVIDPKGENATVTAARRGRGTQTPNICEGMGQNVYVLDPFSQAKVDSFYKARFNPLDTIDPHSNEAIDDAGHLADAIVVTGEAKDPHWEESARAVIKTLILHVITLPVYEGRRNLATVRNLILQGETEMVAALKKKGKENIPSAQTVLWDMVRRNKALHGVIAAQGENFFEIITNSPKEYNSIRSVAARNTEFIDSPGMKDILSQSDFKISDLKTGLKGVSLYLTLPQRYMSTHFRWLRMMTSLITTEMEKTPGKPVTGHQILMCLDEFAGLKRMEVIENAVSQIAGYGVKLLFVLQSLEQLKATYPDRWETFLANASLKIFYAIEDKFTREYISQQAGEEEVIRDLRTNSQSYGTQETDTYGSSAANTASDTYSSSYGTASGNAEMRGGNSFNSRNSGAARGNIFHPGDLIADAIGNAFGGNVVKQWGSGSQYGTTTNFTQNQNKTNAQTRSETHTSTQSRATSRTQTTTHGTNESLHKRPLITPDEVGRYFARIDKDRNPIAPGLALIMISGEHPVTVRKTNYFEDMAFARKYSPHPDHAYIDLIEEKLSFEEAEKKRISEQNRKNAEARKRKEQKEKELEAANFKKMLQREKEVAETAHLPAKVSIFVAILTFIWVTSLIVFNGFYPALNWYDGEVIGPIFLSLIMILFLTYFPVLIIYFGSLWAGYYVFAKNASASPSLDEYVDALFKDVIVESLPRWLKANSDHDYLSSEDIMVFRVMKIVLCVVVIHIIAILLKASNMGFFS